MSYLIVKWNRLSKAFLRIDEAGVIAGVLTYSLALPEAEACDAVGGVFRP